MITFMWNGKMTQGGVLQVDLSYGSLYNICRVKLPTDKKSVLHGNTIT